MFNYLKNSSFILCVLFSSFVVNATLIKDTHYITVDHGNGNLVDWAWASSTSVEFIYLTEIELINGVETEISVLDNHFSAPDTITGWRVASTDEFNYFLNNIFLSDFTKTSGDYITAHNFWNTNDIGVDSIDFSNRDITSSWVKDSTLDYNQGLEPDMHWFDTFYARTHVDTQPVPEPSTLMIFALGLIALASKKKLSK